mgnify:CR=1 FL=1
MDYIKDRLREYERRGVDAFKDQPGDESGLNGRVRFVVLEMSPITSIDSTGLHAIKVKP